MVTFVQPLFFMAKQYVRLPQNIADIKDRIIERNEYSSHDVNDAILTEIKKYFETLVEVEVKKGKRTCKICLNHRESKLMDEITAMYGITFSQLYISAIIEIGKKEKLLK